MSGIDRFHVFDNGLDKEVHFGVWSPPGVGPEEHHPLVVVHDGTEFDENSRLIHEMYWMMKVGAIDTHRVALVDPVFGERNNWYGSSIAYSNALVNTVIPAIQEKAPTDDPLTVMGVSLGATAMFAAVLAAEYWRDEPLIGRLYSSSARFDPLENDDRIPGLVEQMRKVKTAKHTLQITMTCDSNEPNFMGNYGMSHVLSDQGHFVRTANAPGGHRWGAWHAALWQNLPELLNRAS